MYLVCGEALFDVFSNGRGPSAVLQLEAHAGGSPFNVAVGIARLGGRSALLTGISNDMLGQRLAGVLKREGVSTDYLVRSGNRTALSLVGVDERGQPEYAFYGLGSADCGVEPDDLPSVGQEISALHFGSYSLVVRPVADAFSRLLDMAGNRFVSVDPNVRLNVDPDVDMWRRRVSEYAARADLVKIGSEDLKALYPSTAADAKAAEWLDQGAGLVVVTDGGGTVCAWTQRGHAVRVDPPGANVVDAVGAGDSFQSALLAKLAEDGGGDPGVALTALDRPLLEDLLIFAAEAAHITCQRRGADLPRRDELPVRAGKP